MERTSWNELRSTTSQCAARTRASRWLSCRRTQSIPTSQYVMNRSIIPTIRFTLYPRNKQPLRRAKKYIISTITRNNQHLHYQTNVERWLLIILGWARCAPPQKQSSAVMGKPLFLKNRISSSNLKRSRTKYDHDLKSNQIATNTN